LLRREHGIQICIGLFLSASIGSACSAQSSTEAQLVRQPDQLAQPKSASEAEKAPARGNQPGEETKPNEDLEEAARTAFERKQYIEAWRLNPSGYPLLSGIDAPSASAGASWYARSGDPGTSRLGEWASYPTLSFIHGDDIFALALGLISLDAGAPGPDAQIGGPGPPVAAPTTRLGIGVAPEFSWSREGSVRPFLAIGSTPFNGIVGPTVEGRLGAAVRLGETKMTTEAYRTPVADAILSYTGIIDPSTGLGFGRVVETGGKVEIEHPITQRWSFDGSASAGTIRGVDVADNAHFSIQTDLSYDLRLPLFDSFTVGPSYQYDSYNRNLSAFTLGQGGYFSPQASHQIGVSIDFQSHDGQDFITRGNFFAGWATNYQASSPMFPLSDNGERFPALHQYGASVTGEFAAAYRMTARLSLGGLVRFRQSPQYNDLLLGLSLKLSFRPRAALFSSDLPTAVTLLGASER
jgi:hypothetical protein